MGLDEHSVEAGRAREDREGSHILTQQHLSNFHGSHTVTDTTDRWEVSPSPRAVIVGGLVRRVGVGLWLQTQYYYCISRH